MAKVQIKSEQITTFGGIFSSKGHLYVFMVTFDALCPLFTNDADYFRYCFFECV